MSWMSDFLKHITVSRSFVFAVFVTSGVLLFGKLYFPEIINPLPERWAIVVSGALVFSSVLLLWWLIPAAGKLISSLFKRTAQFVRSQSLSELEESLLLAMANLADESLDLRSINYSEINLPKLEVLQVASALSKKGLIRINSYEENLISLTSRGRERALQIQRGHRAQEDA